MRVVYDPLSCQGAGHAIVAPPCRSVRLLRHDRRPPRPPLRTTPAPAVLRRPLRHAADAPSPPGSAPPASPPTSAPPTTPSGPPADAPKPSPIACSVSPCCRLMRRPQATPRCSPSTTRPRPATDPACRAPASITTPRPARPARSSSTATSGSPWPGWSTTPPGTPWPCRCAPCSTSARRTCRKLARHIPGTFAPSWNWPPTWSVG